jgi:FkbM family methyltransferase
MNDFDLLWRSGSPGLVWNRGRRRFKPGQVASFRWRGHPFFYRPGSSDISVIRTILLEDAHRAEYFFPPGLTPEVCLDIGANIGCCAVHLANLYPGARHILAFEPVPENGELLRKNTAPYGNVAVVPVALDGEEGEMAMHPPTTERDFVGFSRHSFRVCEGISVSIPVKRLDRVLQERGITQPDLIKVDAEGCEVAILDTLPPEMLGRVTWITGELHSRPGDFAFLDRLSTTHLVGVRKRADQNLYRFHALNRSRRDEAGSFDWHRLG